MTIIIDTDNHAVEAPNTQPSVDRVVQLEAPASDMTESTTSHVFELRTYYPADGMLAALHRRFQDHTLRLFARHGIGVVGFWIADAGTVDERLVYLLRHETREGRDAAWQEFRDDPEWQLARAESVRDGELTRSIESVILVPTRYSPLQ